jgi:hypothetical protein
MRGSVSGASSLGVEIARDVRAALQTPPEKKRAVRAGRRITEDRFGIFKEEAEGRDRFGKQQGKAEKSASSSSLSKWSRKAVVA